MEIRPVGEHELPEVVALIAAQQARPERHIAYESCEPDAILAELAELEPEGLAAVLVAVGGDGLLGAIAAEWDDRPPRVWWHGPFVAGSEWASVATALLEHGRTLLPSGVTQEELAPDDRHEELAGWARGQGFQPEEASVLLGRDLAEVPPVTGLPGVELEPLDDQNRAAVAALHDALFPGTHLAGDQLDHGTDRVVVVARRDGEVVGYAAAERQAGGEGDLDFLGVAETARGRGIGGLLVARVSGMLAAELGCEHIHLTVREGNAAARRLYARAGFNEDRLVRPWRRGFSLA